MDLSLSKETLDQLAQWYQDNEIPPALRKVDPRVLERAMRLAAGDIHRCSTDGDGSIVVWNQTVW